MKTSTASYILLIYCIESEGRLGIHSVFVRKLSEDAMRRALESGETAYDTVSVELAHRERLSLVTFDNRPLKTYPDIAKRPRDLT